MGLRGMQVEKSAADILKRMVDLGTVPASQNATVL
jgi:hypothetical protein